MMNHGLRLAVMIVCLGMNGLPLMATAQESDSAALSQTAEIPASGKATESSALKSTELRFNGNWSAMFGQMANFWMLNSNIQRQDLLRTIVNFGVDKQLTPRLEMHAALEGKMYFNTFDKKYNFGVEAFVLPAMYYNFYIHRADMVYSLGNPQSPVFQFDLGYFPYKYNPDVKDLGEYLYRSGTYPAFLINEFDFPMARLAGLKLSFNSPQSFVRGHLDGLFTIETDRPPFYDLNFGAIISGDIGKFLTFGFGLMYHSLVEANDGLTTPRDPANVMKVDSTLGVDAQGLPAYYYDTTFYTYAGLKLMTRFSFDPKYIVPGDLDFLGKEDLRLYGEMSILGVKDYPATTTTSNNPYGYDTLFHKMPIMLGFNWFTHPALSYGLMPLSIIAFADKNFKNEYWGMGAVGLLSGALVGVGTSILDKLWDRNLRLDVLSIELEYYGMTYPDNFEYKNQTQVLPDPCIQTGGTLSPYNYSTLDNWKWAVYMKKSYPKLGLFWVAQVACDHIRNETPIASSVDMEDALRTDRAWWWAFKLGYMF